MVFCDPKPNSPACISPPARHPRRRKMLRLPFLMSVVYAIATTATAFSGLISPRFSSPARFGALQMALNPPDAMPKDLKLATSGNDGPTVKTTEDLFSGKRCIVFGISGAFEPDSSAVLKSMVAQHEELTGLGAEMVACVSVNDPYVMKEWGRALGTGDKIVMLADAPGTFSDALGYLSYQGEVLGKRSKGFALVLDQDMGCEFSSVEGNLTEKVLGHLRFISGTSFLEAAPSKAAELARKVAMESGNMQEMMAKAYDKARLETTELSRVKNDFVAKLEMAGRQATIRLKTMGEIGIAAFQADASNTSGGGANVSRADNLPDEVFLRTTPMNLAKRNALEANRRQWGIGYDPKNPQRLKTDLQTAAGETRGSAEEGGSSTSDGPGEKKTYRLGTARAYLKDGTVKLEGARKDTLPTEEVLVVDGKIQPTPPGDEPSSAEDG